MPEARRAPGSRGRLSRLDPYRRATAFGLLATFGGALLWLAETAEAWAGAWTQLAAVPGTLCLFIGVPLMIGSLNAATRGASLAAGRGVVARWRVEAEDWSGFATAEAARTGPDWPANRLSPVRLDGSESLEIVVGRDAVLVGPAFFGLSRWGDGAPAGTEWIEGDPACLSVLGRGGRALRLPVPVGATAEGRLALAHFEARVPPKGVRREARWVHWVFRAAMGLTLVLGACGVVGLARAIGGEDSDAVAALVALGAFGAPFVALIGAMVLAIGRRFGPIAPGAEIPSR